MHLRRLFSAGRRAGADDGPAHGLRDLVALGVREPARLSEARESATALAAAGHVDADEVLSFSRSAIWAVEQENGRPTGLVMGEIAYAAGAGLPRPGAAHRQLGCDRVEIAHLVLVHEPDAALLRDATRIGEETVAEAEAAGDTGIHGSALHRLGCLYLDPWSHAPDGYADEHRLWLSLARDGAAVDGLPEPLDALRRADGYLRAAERLRTGAALGRTLKARAQCLVQRRHLGEEITEHVSDLRARAAALLPASASEVRLALDALDDGS